MPRIAGAVIVAVVLMLMASPAPCDGPKAHTIDGTDIEVRADKVLVDAVSGLARFEGRVSLRKGALFMLSERLEAGSGAARLEAVGQVALSTGSLVATAERAVFEPEASRVTLSGGPVVWRGRTRILGKRAILDLTRGTIEIDAPRGRLELPRQDRKSDAGGKRKQ